MGNKSSHAAGSNDGAKNNRTLSSSPPSSIPNNVTLLRGCTSVEEHRERVRRAVRAADGLAGEEGLRALGFEFRFAPCCPAHDPSAERPTLCVDVDDAAASAAGDGDVTPPQSPVEDRSESLPTIVSLTTTAASSPSEASRTMAKSASVVSFLSGKSDLDQRFADCCHRCATRLFYVGSRKVPNLDAVETDQSKCLQRKGPSSSESTSNDEQPTSSADEIPIHSHHHQEDATMITPSNRKQYIADGAMYELVANLAQQASQSRMCASFDLEWVTVCDETNLGERVRALVDRDHRLLLQDGENRMVLRELLGNAAPLSDIEKEEKKDDDDHVAQHEEHHEALSSSSSSRNSTKSTLLIATGRGKVRAGIFSRHHLLTAGIEMGTSWHCIREARMRKWGVAIIDPNARGEEAGYESFKRSVSRLFEVDGDGDEATKRKLTSRKSSCASISTTASSASASSWRRPRQSRSIYILAHSASGGQLVRHLREDPSLLPSIRAVAFTDSTHNVQWCKHNPALQSFLQKENCVYLRSNDVRSSQSCVRVSSRGKDVRCDCATCEKGAGAEAETDRFWRHRFGGIRTLWAGTADHALSNWAGHESIWDHFDEQTSDDGDAL